MTTVRRLLALLAAPLALAALGVAALLMGALLPAGSGLAQGQGTPGSTPRMPTDRNHPLNAPPKNFNPPDPAQKARVDATRREL